MKFKWLWYKNYHFMMRSLLLIIALITISLQLAYSSSASAQGIMDQKLSLQIESKTLKKSIEIIAKKTQLNFLYTTETLSSNKKINFYARDETLREILNKLLGSRNFQFELSDQRILIFPGNQSQDITVTGTVSDENGEPLPGVSVYPKDSQLGTTTDVSGKYSIKIVDEKASLKFSFLGYITQEVVVGRQTQINVKLIPDNKALNEVVVTALNIKRSERSLGYAVTQLSGDKVSTVQTPNLINALSGKVAGVDVGNIGSGVAGSKRVVIRGSSSLTGNNQPLWVIDGIPINSSSLGGLANNAPEGGIDYGDALTGINPDDIESISVLKGNAAAALYGSLASNGVIIVTTKSGKSVNGRTNVEFNSSSMTDHLINLTDFQKQYGQTSKTNAMQLPDNAADAYSSDSWGHKLDGSPAVQFDGVTRPFSYVEDNYKNFFRTGSTITNTLALSGSNTNNNFRISLSDLRNTDIVPNANYSRTSFNAKTSSKFGKLDADVVVNYTYEKALNRPFIGGNHSNLFYSLFYLPGNIDINTLSPGYHPDGSEFTYADGISNPYFVADKTHEDDSKNTLRGSISLKYNFGKLLYVRGRYTRDYYVENRSYYIPEGNLYTSFPDGQLNQQSRQSVVNNYEFIAGINPVKFNKFEINAFVGGNKAVYPRSSINTSGNSFVIPGVYTFNNLGTKQPTTSATNQKTNSLFGSAEFAYDNFLFLTLTGRNDWFSTLPTNNNNLFYPSAALSFVFSDAFKLPSSISFGKFRASTAQVSGDTGPGQLDLSYSLTQTSYNGLPLQYIGTSNIPNKDLKPLSSTDYEFGLEMDFFENRFGFDIDYYRRETKDDIVTTAVSGSSGYATAVLNVGRLKNSGVELLLRATPVKKQNFSWDLTATFSKNNSKVIALGDQVENTPIILAKAKGGEAIVQLEEGKAYGGIYGFAYQRDEKGNKVYNSLGNPLATSNFVYLGNGVYDKLTGLSNNFNFKKFSLYFLLDGKFGADLYSETNATAYDNGKHKATLVGRETGLTPKGVDKDGNPNMVMVTPEKLSSYYKQVGNIAEQFIYDASFIKLREASLRYNIPHLLLNKIKVRDASISFIARNLLTIYKDKNLENVDPESNISSGNDQGIERLVYPTTRSFGLSLKIGL